MITEFTDEVLHGIKCDSKSSRNKSFVEAQMQSEPYKIYHRGIQSKRYKTQEIQTDWLHQDEELNNTDNKNDSKTQRTKETKLINFLKRIEPIMTKEIQNNITSKAFKRLESRKIFNRVDALEKYLLILDKAKEDKLSVTGLSWNSTGALLAISYGSICHTDWCTHVGYAALWNVTSSTLESNNPKHKYTTNSCLMCIKCHPTIPSLLAGGTYTGNVVIWDLSRGNDYMLTNTEGTTEIGHKDCINQIEWISNYLQSDFQSLNLNNMKNIHIKSYRLLTAGSDGRIICWQIDLHPPEKINCIKIFQIRNKDQTSLPMYSYSNSLNHSTLRSNLSDLNNERSVNITCLSISKNNPDKFIVGTEVGGLLICEMDSVNWDTNHQESVNEYKQSPVKFSLARQVGPIYSVDWSAFHHNLILSCGLNQGVQIFNVLQKSPLININPSEGLISGAKFSPHYPNIFICITEFNQILIYDLADDDSDGEMQIQMTTMEDVDREYNYQPTLMHTLTSVIDNTNQGSLITVEFNHKSSRLLATGSTDGNTYIWDLGTLINELSPKIT
uniref:WD_REPEATS_REGION domain-containing protein n=1 Tax=Trichobilharzia regenti TaxID=157069 RepID=A0AA85IT83_TRIRE|nr:unnamed protein product [Trichobilharzia regenti]